METEELIETIKKMNAGKLTPEEMEIVSREQIKANKKADEELLKVKENVDLNGCTDVTMGDKRLCEIEKYMGGYKISFYTGTSELELIKIYRIKEFPDRKWFEDKWRWVLYSSISSIF